MESGAENLDTIATWWQEVDWVSGNKEMMVNNDNLESMSTLLN